MSFLTDFNKESKKISGISLEAVAPKFWIPTGNFVLNKVISGSFSRGIAQGRMFAVAGPSSAGKSFIAANVAYQAQQMGCGILVVDSENAMDNKFMGDLGTDTTAPDYVYRGVSTINQATQVVSSFLKSYRRHGETQPFLIIVDSLDELATESAVKAFDDGETKGDQGQHAKQIKAMLSPFMHEIKDLNVAILCTKKVYQEQDPMLNKNPATAWKMTESSKYPFSQIALITRLFLKDKDTKNYEGFRLKVFGLKTRFTKPFQQATLEVPYDTGMDPYNGLLDAAIAMGVVTTPTKGWNLWNDNKFQVSNFATYQDAILEELKTKEGKALHVEVADEEEVVSLEEDKKVSAKDETMRRAAKASAAAKSEETEE